MAVFTLSNTRKAGNTKMGNEKREMRKKEERKRKNTGRTPMLQKWSMSIKPFGGIHAE